MKKNHVSFIALTLILVLLIFITPVQLQNIDIERFSKTSKAFTSVARSISSSVLFIQVEGTPLRSPYYPFPMPLDDEAPFSAELFERLFGERFGFTSKPKAALKKSNIIGQGSGFIFASKESLFGDKSYILTNNHVVEHAEKIEVILQDSRKFEAKIVGTDPKSDIAVLEIQMNELPPLTLGDSSKLQVGECVAAIGNSFVLSPTVTVGVVSAAGRSSLDISDYQDYIQTDAAINSGSSGGPLVNLDGDVVGINTVIFSKSAPFRGIGHAIPINFAHSIAKQLMANGKVAREPLGILTQALSPNVTMGKLTLNKEQAIADEQPSEELGFSVQNITPYLAEKLMVKSGQGVLVTEVITGSVANMANIKVGSVILQVNQIKIENVKAFSRALKNRSKVNSVLLLIKTNNSQHYIELN
jgi:serine protease Do